MFSLNDYKWLGFDLDHTLAPYNTHALEDRMFSVALRFLAKDAKCNLLPSDVEGYTYNHEFSARGIVIDRTLGNVVQLDADKRGNVPTRTVMSSLSFASIASSSLLRILLYSGLVYTSYHCNT